MTEDTARLREASERYPASVGFYLRYRFISDDALRRFIANEPVGQLITFPNRSKTELEGRLERLRSEIKLNKEYPATRQFLQLRINETLLLLYQIDLAKAGGETALPGFESCNKTLYAPPRRHLFDMLWRYASSGPGERSPMAVSMWTEAFNKNYELLQQAAGPLVASVARALEAEPDASVAAVTVLDELGWSKDGWRVRFDASRNSATVAPRSKQLILGSAITRVPRASQIALLSHELTHVWRATGREVPYPTPPALELASFEEGIAHMVETIARGGAPYPARYWRYLAIGLAVGTDGGPKRNAKEVYDLLLPLYEKKAGRTPEESSRFVFGTVMRVWQGCPLAMAGAVLFRDTRYAEGSLLVWKFLQDEQLTPDRLNYVLRNKVVKWR